MQGQVHSLWQAENRSSSPLRRISDRQVGKAPKEMVHEAWSYINHGQGLRSWGRPQGWLLGGVLVSAHRGRALHVHG